MVLAIANEILVSCKPKEKLFCYLRTSNIEDSFYQLDFKFHSIMKNFIQVPFAKISDRSPYSFNLQDIIISFAGVNFYAELLKVL